MTGPDVSVSTHRSPNLGAISPPFLSEDERILIAEMLQAGSSLRAIAETMNTIFGPKSA